MERGAARGGGGAATRLCENERERDLTGALGGEGALRIEREGDRRMGARGTTLRFIAEAELLLLLLELLVLLTCFLWCPFPFPRPFPLRVTELSEELSELGAFFFATVFFLTNITSSPLLELCRLY